MRNTLVVTWLVSVLFGCDILGLDTATRIGVLASNPSPPGRVQPIFLPDSVAVGEEFTVIVYTKGIDCDKAHSTRVAIEGNVALITPYDTYQIRGNCITLPAFFEHRAKIIFTHKRQGTILIRVRISESNRELQTLVRTVHVY